MRRKPAALLLVAVILAAGCATVTVNATRTEPHARPARPAGYPIELVPDPVPERPHKVIGSVRARVKLSEFGDRVAPPEKVVAALKEQARVLGGDALLPTSVTPAAGGGAYLSPPTTLRTGNSQVWNALVIVWLGEDS